MKVGDKVRCVKQSDHWSREYFTIGNIYEICRINDGHESDIQVSGDDDVQWDVMSKDFELVQEDKLPHELLGLDRYRVVKKDESDPLWVEFWFWYNTYYQLTDNDDRREYFGYDGAGDDNGTNAYKDITSVELENNLTLITLTERDRIVNKKQSQTKKLSEKYTYTNQVLRSDGVLFTPNEIGGEKVSDIKERYNKDRSLLRKHKDLFGNQ